MIDSVRAKLTLWYVGVLAVALLGFSVGLYALLARQLHEQVDQKLRDSIQAITKLIPHEMSEEDSEKKALTDAVEEPDIQGQSVAVFNSAGETLIEKTVPGGIPPLLPIAEPKPTAAVQIYSLPGEQGGRAAIQRTVVAPANSTYLIVVNQSLAGVTRELEGFRRILFAAVPVALALAALGGWFLARRSLAPVVEMSERADQIGAESLEQRLPVANPRDEIGRLATIFNNLLGRLDEAFAQQRQFMADASHELRTPLSVIHTTAEVTLEQAHRGEGEYRETIAMMDAQAQRLARIVEQMFILARADTGRYPLYNSDFYLDELVSETARAASVLAMRKGVVVDVAKMEETLYEGDEGLLRQMLLNLLDNAIKHTLAGGVVRVRLASHDSTHEITVADTGSGVPVEAQAHIFKRFYRVDKARSRNGAGDGGGAGLGLSIARWIAEAHDGRLTLRHSGETGSIFVASLPAFESASGQD